ncbi:hypothetical protein GYA28_02405 [Candidatus Roizmanbacteria bacterium]|nr:hypothetical protein [Candidatus Roizmanbacteria bacterium]
MKTNNLITIFAAIVALIIGFFAGTKFQGNKSLSSFGQPGQFAGQTNGSQFNGRNLPADQQGQTRTRSGGGQVMGEVISQDSQSITVKMRDGSSKIVLLSESTAINKAATASAKDLTTGSQVAVFGTQNTDGSITASNIQLNPVLRNISGTPRQ